MLGEKLKKLRVKRGYSQQQVADAVNVSRQYISKLEGDEHVMPSLDIALKLARLFDVEVETFIEDSPAAARTRPINAIMSELDHAIKEMSLTDLQRPARVPFYGTVPCGNLLISESGGEYMVIPDSWVHGIENPFIIRVRGDWLTDHGIYHGDYMIIDPDAPLVAGKIYLTCCGSQVSISILENISDTGGVEIVGRAVTAFSRKQL